MRRIRNLVAEFLRLQLPQPLPLTDQGFDSLCKLVLGKAKMPDNDSTRQALGTLILHADKNKYKFRPVVFVRALLRSAASQAAYNCISEIKERQDAKRKEMQQVSSDKVD